MPRRLHTADAHIGPDLARETCVVLRVHEAQWLVPDVEKSLWHLVTAQDWGLDCTCPKGRLNTAQIEGGLVGAAPRVYAILRRQGMLCPHVVDLLRLSSGPTERIV